MEQCLNYSKTILDALSLLDDVRLNQTLFVVDNQGLLYGSLTDGDIRRYIVNGGQLSDRVQLASNVDCMFIRKNDQQAIFHIREFKQRGINAIPVVDELGRVVEVYDVKNFKSNLPVDAVLMAGGKGERLRPLTENTPKPLLKMKGKAIIDYIVEHIISYGIKNISVTVNYLKEQIEVHYAKPFKGVHVKTVSEPKYLGTIGSLAYVQEFKNDTVLLMNSDAITDINLEDFFLHFLEHDADMSVAAIPYTISVPYGILDLDGRNIKGVREKPTFIYYANTGIYLIKRDLLSNIPSGEFFNATDFMELLVAKGYRVIRFPLNGTWIDIGNLQEYQKAMELIKHLR